MGPLVTRPPPDSEREKRFSRGGTKGNFERPKSRKGFVLTTAAEKEMHAQGVYDDGVEPPQKRPRENNPRFREKHSDDESDESPDPVPNLKVLATPKDQDDNENEDDKETENANEDDPANHNEKDGEEDPMDFGEE